MHRMKYLVPKSGTQEYNLRLDPLLTSLFEPLVDPDSYIYDAPVAPYGSAGQK